MFNNEGYSLSDIAAVTKNGDGMFGNDNGGAWWIILLFILLNSTSFAIVLILFIILAILLPGEYVDMIMDKIKILLKRILEILDKILSFIIVEIKP